jgi:hypothetical protein
MPNFHKVTSLLLIVSLVDYRATGYTTNKQHRDNYEYR